MGFTGSSSSSSPSSSSSARRLASMLLLPSALIVNDVWEPNDGFNSPGSQMTGSTRLPASLTCQRGPPSARQITTIDTGSVVVHANTDLLGAVTECS